MGAVIGQLQKQIYKPIVPVIRIQGFIDFNTTADVQMSLNKINPYISKAFSVVINSPGGSPTQCDLISQKLKLFAHEHHLPLYTFAEEVTTAGAYYILQCGDHIYADQSSQVGSVGKDPKYIGLQTIENQQNKYQFTSENDLWYLKREYFDQMNQSEQKEMKEFLNNQHGLFIKQLQVDNKNIKEQNEIFFGNQIKEQGLVPNIGTYLDVLSNQYANSDIVQIEGKNFKQKVNVYMRNCLQIIKTVNNRNKKQKVKSD